MPRAIFLTDDHGRGKVLLDEEVVASAPEAWAKEAVRDPVLLARIAAHTSKGGPRARDESREPLVVEAPEGTLLLFGWADGQDARVLLAPPAPVQPRPGARVLY